MGRGGYTFCGNTYRKPKDLLRVSAKRALILLTLKICFPPQLYFVLNQRWLYTMKTTTHTHTHTCLAGWLIDRFTLLTLNTNERRQPSPLLQKIISIILLSPALSWPPVLNTRYDARSVLCVRVQDALLVTSANRLCIEPSRFSTFTRIIPILSFLHVVVVVE